MLRLGPGFPPNYGGTPRRMSVRDLAIWQRWRSRHSAQWQTLYFDAELGGGADIPAHFNQDWRDFWQRETSKRADVIASTPTNWWIIELRFNALPNAVGRLLTYEMLWHDDPPDTKPVTLWLVTDREDPATKRICEAHRISYAVV